MRYEVLSCKHIPTAVLSLRSCEASGTRAELDVCIEHERCVEIVVAADSYTTRVSSACFACAQDSFFLKKNVVCAISSISIDAREGVSG